MARISSAVRPLRLKTLSKIDKGMYNEVDKLLSLVHMGSEDTGSFFRKVELRRAKIIDKVDDSTTESQDEKIERLRDEICRT